MNLKELELLATTNRELEKLRIREVEALEVIGHSLKSISQTMAIFCQAACEEDKKYTASRK